MMLQKDFGCNRQKITFEQRSSSQIAEEEKEKVDKGTMHAYLHTLQIRGVQADETQVTDDIFRPRSDDSDLFSDRRLFLSTPLPLVNSTDINIPNLNHVVSDKSNDENCVSRFHAFNSISKDLSKSSFTCPLLEEYRVPTSGEELCIHGSSKLDAFKECRSF